MPTLNFSDAAGIRSIFIAQKKDHETEPLKDVFQDSFKEHLVSKFDIQSACRWKQIYFNNQQPKLYPSLP